MSKHGGGGRYNAFLEFKGEQIKNEKEKRKRKNEYKEKEKKYINEKKRKKI
jgi:hypothetical protein